MANGSKFPFLIDSKWTFSRPDDTDLNKEKNEYLCYITNVEQTEDDPHQSGES